MMVTVPRLKVHMHVYVQVVGKVQPVQMILMNVLTILVKMMVLVKKTVQILLGAIVKKVGKD